MYRTFGSWGAALTAAGFEAPPAGPPRRPGGWDKDAVIEAINDWVDRFGQPPRLSDWSPSLARSLGYAENADLFEAERPRYPLASRATRLFGTWNAALQAAEQRTTQTGLRRSTPRAQNAPPGTHTAAWTRDGVIAALKAFADVHGRPPTYDEWAAADAEGRRPSSGTIFEMFGSWRAGVLAADLNPRSYTRRR